MSLASKLKKQPKCIWCGEPMNLEVNHPRQATREHLVPTSLGGWRLVKQFYGKKKNIALACKECNSRRGNTLNTCTEHTPKDIKKLIGRVHRMLEALKPEEVVDGAEQ